MNRDSFWGEENVLKLMRRWVHNTATILKAIELYTLKWANCVVCKLYLNKAVLKRAVVIFFEWQKR